MYINDRYGLNWRYIMPTYMSGSFPVWPGSSSFAIGRTAFGFYDADPEFTSSADKVADWCARRLGFPFVDIELADVNFYSAFEDAITEYGAQVNQFNARENMLLVQGLTASIDLTQREISPSFGRVVRIAKSYGSEAGSGGNVTYYSASISVTSGQQTYDLSPIFSASYGELDMTNIEVKRIYHEPTPAIVRYFDPYAGTAMGVNTLLNEFGFGNYSVGLAYVMLPVYADILRLQAIEFNDQIRKSGYSFELINNTLKLFPRPTYNFNVWIQYIKVSERDNPLKTSSGRMSDISNVNYQNISYQNINSIGKRWILQYTLAVAKEMLGNVRRKYSEIPIPDATVTMDGDLLRQEAQQEKEKLIEQLRETLEETSRKSQMEKQKEQNENLRETLKAVPMKIYIG